MADSVEKSADNGYTDVRVRLPNRMIHKIEELRKGWGLQSRSDVVARLFDEVFKEG